MQKKMIFQVVVLGRMNLVQNPKLTWPPCNHAWSFSADNVPDRDEVWVHFKMFFAYLDAEYVVVTYFFSPTRSELKNNEVICVLSFPGLRLHVSGHKKAESGRV